MKRVRLTTLLVVFLAATLVGIFFASGARAQATDPTQRLDRIRIVITSSSYWARLTVPAGDVIVNSKGGVTNGNATSSVKSTSILLSQSTAGSAASAQYDVLLTTDGTSDDHWQITKASAHDTSVQIYNINDTSAPFALAAVTDNGTSTAPVDFVIAISEEDRGGPLSAGSPGLRKVIACYVPWYGRNSWDDPKYKDRPLTPYSVGTLSDVQGVVATAASGGIDGFTTSFQGIDRNGQAFQTLMDAANQRNDFEVSAYIETGVANASHTDGVPDPAYLRQWITQVVQSYGSQPAYMRQDSKPVIFIYRARLLTPQQWKNDVFDPLRAQGIDAFYVADYVEWDWVAPVPEYLAVFDGMHSFNPSLYSTISVDSLRNCLTSNSQMTKTYSLLNDTSAPRKLWMGTVVPGFDDTGFRTPGKLIPRDDGNFYNLMWNVNMSTAPDWIMVTTWNDYMENTHIEPSVNYGTQYLDLTHSWADSYRSEQAGIVGLASSASLPPAFTVTWHTDWPSRGKVIYGTQPGVYDSSISVVGYGLEHSLTAAGLTPGTVYYAKAVSRDQFGFEAESPEFSIAVPAWPAPTITGIAPEGIVGGTSASIHADFQDSGGGIDVNSAHVYLDSDELTGCITTEASISCPAAGLADGDHSFNISIRDLFGTPAEASGRFTVDASPPVVTNVEPSGVVMTSYTDITASYHDDSGIEAQSVSLMLDGNQLTGCYATTSDVRCPVTGLTRGPHDIAGTVSDIVGNTATINGSFTADPRPDLVLEQAGADPPAGGKVRVNVTIRNVGPNPAYNVRLTGAQNTNGAALSSNVPINVAWSLQPGASATVTVKYIVPPSTTQFMSSWTGSALNAVSGGSFFYYSYPSLAIDVPAR